jgi:hypothetical protein
MAKMPKTTFPLKPAAVRADKGRARGRTHSQAYRVWHGGLVGFPALYVMALPAKPRATMGFFFRSSADSPEHTNVIIDQPFIGTDDLVIQHAATTAGSKARPPVATDGVRELAYYHKGVGTAFCSASNSRIVAAAISISQSVGSSNTRM